MRRLLPALALTLAATLRPTPVPAQQPSQPKGRKAELSHEEFYMWTTYNNAGRVALAQRRLDTARENFERAIAIARLEADRDPRLLARSYGDLAWVLHGQGRHAEAEPLAEWALTVREKAFGRDSLQAGQTAYTLAMIEVDLGKLDEAEVHLAQSLEANEKGSGADDVATADALDDMATLLVQRRSYDRARPLFERALAIFRKASPNHVGQYVPLDGLATIDLSQGRYAEADARLADAIKSLERDPYANPPYRAAVLARRAEVLRKLGRADEAAKVEARSKEVAALPALTRPPDRNVTSPLSGRRPSAGPGR